MVEDQNGVLNVQLEPENKELVNKLAREIMEPALQKALKEARDKASPVEIMSALANAYGGFLVDLLGARAAASLMRGHADHIATREQSQVSNETN
jgi:hypothetical protein